MTNSISMNPIYKDSISVKRVLLTLVGGQNAPFRKCPSSLGGGGILTIIFLVIPLPPNLSLAPGHFAPPGRIRTNV